MALIVLLITVLTMFNSARLEAKNRKEIKQILEDGLNAEHAEVEVTEIDEATGLPTTVWRDVPAKELVPGDIVRVRGDWVVPADCGRGFCDRVGFSILQL